jgi:CubicO group peptidase (beta-lactamase class C family)
MRSRLTALIVFAPLMASCGRTAAPIVVAPTPDPAVTIARARADSITAAAAAAQLLERTRIESTLRAARPEDVGMNPATLDSMDSMILQMLRDGAAPGAAVAVGRHGRIVRLGGYGVLDLRDGFGAVNDSTLYDMASLTKVVGSTTALMMLVDDGKVQLDAPVKQYIPEWSGTPEKEAVTVRNILLHNSGLAAGGNLWQTYHGKEEFRARVAAQELVYPTDTKSIYSDFSGMMMGFIVEQVSGMSLDRFLHDRLFAPLGLHETGFVPLAWPAGTTIRLPGDTSMAGPDSLFWKSRIAPTEISQVAGGGQQIQGRVHDENAYAMGGVSGHAGLFSSARDMAVFSQMLLNHGYYAGHRYIQAATIDTFMHRYNTYSSRALGWDTPTPNSSAGDYFTPPSFGHTGFTGTSIWIDPIRDVFVVLLTNRVDPTRENNKHLALRRMVADMVQQSIVDMPVEKRIDPPRQLAPAEPPKTASASSTSGTTSSKKAGVSRKSSKSKKPTKTKSKTAKKSKTTEKGGTSH